ncbi:lipase family protein [Nocardia sp. BMG51109]|uniref:lipase family protein n=1 Tax=Nocardia sp. BMG51109 TaxID=1056816 RepID=UPI000464B536|nr:lipase family protein [Nocardia sp. BMG51109]
MANFAIRRVVGACAGSLVLLAGAVGAASGQPFYPAVDPDPFYAAPGDIAEHQPGDVLGIRALPPLAVFPDTDVWLVKFRSTNSEDKPIAATTTVLAPRKRAVDGPLLSYQTIINGLGTECSISHTLYTDDPNLMVREAPGYNVALQRGWTIALPDHLGPEFAYGAARLGGQITLDGIRAVQRVEQLRLGRSPVTMAGYSGGGMATAWAAALAPKYAPDLHIAGAAAGGVPMNMVKMLEGLGFGAHPVFGLAFAAGIGLEREYPDRFPISDQLNDEGLRVGHQVANGCTNDLLAAGAGRGALDFAKTTSMIEDPEARKVVEENSLELYDESVPNMPVFEWHSPIDGLVPIDSIENTNRRWCAAGVRVQSEAIPVPDHLTAAVLGLPQVLGWLDGRVNGAPAPSNC